MINFPMSRFPVGSEPRADIKRFTSEEIAKLLTAASGEFKDMVHFGSMMGLRPKELRELRHDQIDWDAKPRPMLVIEHHKTLQTSRVPIPRSVPLSDVALDILRRQHARHPHSKLVFLNGNGQPYDGFADMWSLNASRPESKGRVLVIDRNKQPLTERDGKPYAGSYCNVMVSFWAQDNANGKRLNCELKAVQFVKDGDAFGGGAPASSDAFDDLGADEGEESLV